MVFDEGLFAHLVDLFQRIHFFLQLKDSIFQHLDIELILALPSRLAHDIHTYLRPVSLPYLPRPFMTLALVVLLNVLRVVLFRPLEQSRMVFVGRRLDFIGILQIMKYSM